MSQNKALSFLTVVLFVGILLSITLYLGLGNLSTAASSEEGEEDVLPFNASFREDHAIQTLVRYCDYEIFRHIDRDTVIIGESDWLFDTRRTDNGYNYLLDYVGGCPYSEAELAKISRWITVRREACAERGAEYLLVVIPNSMTASSEYLPSYIGEQSHNTRLSQLGRYLDQKKESSFLDLSEVMCGDQGEEAFYNNTEDSINAYGAFSLYQRVMTELKMHGRDVEAHLLDAESIQFFTHYTDGKGTAKRVGLERLVSNRTVSLSEDMADWYAISDVTVQCVTTTMTKQGMGNAERLVIECSTEWDKIQLMPFFSNTFETVVYENSIDDGISALDYHDGTILIQVIHESELSLLLQ